MKHLYIALTIFFMTSRPMINMANAQEISARHNSANKASKTQRDVHISLREKFNEFDANDSISQAEVDLLFSPTQKTSFGFNFALRLENKSEQDIKLLNPLDNISVDLISSGEELFTLPFVVPPQLSNVSDIVENQTSRFSFSVLSATLNDKQLTKKEVVALELVIPAKGNLSFDIAASNVQKVLISSRGNSSTFSLGELPKPQELRSGKYKLFFSVSLNSYVGTGGNSKSRIVELPVEYIPLEINNVKASAEAVKGTPLLNNITKDASEPLITIGQIALNFTVVDMNGRIQRLSDFKGKKSLLLTFFPKCFTGGCANHLSGLRDVYPQLQAADVEVLAVSVDPAEGEKGQREFAKQWKLPFSLVPDTTRELSMLYGAAQNDKQLASRMSVLIDKTGTVRWIDTNVNVQTHGTDVLAKVRELGLDVR